MNKTTIATVAASLALSSLGHGATIERFIAPNEVLVANRATGEMAVAKLDGEPVYYCGIDAFKAASAPMIGAVFDVAEVERSFIASGWLRPNVLSDEAQAAVTEGRGGWACASAETPFDLMHSSVDGSLLASVALNESAFLGRPWPWTLNVAGKGFYFASRQDAYSAIQYLLAAKRCDFDVGLMQVNWCYHSKRFASAWAALAPQTNIAVAEDILNENYRKTGSAVKAIAYYHSANPIPGAAYLARFVAHLHQVNHGL